MDAAEIVREMRRNGQGKDEIVSNLRDLGISEPEKYYERVISEEGKGILGTDEKPPEGISEPEIESIMGEGRGSGGNGDSDREAKDILDTETHSLFESSKDRHDAKENEEMTAEKAVEDIPKLEITSVRDGKEETREIGGRKKIGDERPEIMKSMPKTSLQNLDEVERKLDDLISITRAVYDIDRKILDANRDLLLKLKSGK
ncbi:MAG: hypothetical protein ABH863_06070 [Candidatus Micrarchaeota archaeon]